MTAAGIADHVWKPLEVGRLLDQLGVSKQAKGQILYHPWERDKSDLNFLRLQSLRGGLNL